LWRSPRPKLGCGAKERRKNLKYTENIAASYYLNSTERQAILRNPADL
jgi:hypothetical protein